MPPDEIRSFDGTFLFSVVTIYKKKRKNPSHFHEYHAVSKEGVDSLSWVAKELIR